jgi:hypothetical protein
VRRIRERAALTGGAILLGLAVAAVIAARPFRRLAGALARRRRPRSTEREPLPPAHGEVL